MAFSKSLRKRKTLIRKTLKRRGGAAAANATPKAAPKKAASAKVNALALKKKLTEELKSASAKRLEAKKNNNLWGNYRAAKALSNQAKAPNLPSK